MVRSDSARHLLVSASLCAACAGAPNERAAFRLEPFPPQLAETVMGASARAQPPAGASDADDGNSPLAGTRPDSPPAASIAAGERLALDATRTSLTLGEGRWVVAIAVPASHYVTLGVTGAADALARLEVVASRALRRLRSGAADDDGLLPAFVAFESRGLAEELLLVVDVRSPVTLLRIAADVREVEWLAAPPNARPAIVAPTLVGMPFPAESRAGYFLQTPSRYAFVRSDVAAALRHAFVRTAARFKDRGPFAVGDATQWNGARPASDVDRPRHISHGEGRDVDLGLGSTRGLSRIEPHCQGVLVQEDRLECAPGTARDFDAERTGYFLARLLEPPPYHVRPFAELEAILLDQVYADAIRQALPKLRKKQWIGAEAFALLGEEGLMRHSPWHVDHVHLRFRGPAGVVPAELRFEAERAPGRATTATDAPAGGRRD